MAKRSSKKPVSAKNVFFAIPVAPFVDNEQWKRVGELLEATLSSIKNQSDPNHTTFVCGHERPPILDDKRFAFVNFISATFPNPRTDIDRRQDKRRKRWEIARTLRELGGGYYMYLDADDLLHSQLVEFVRNDNNEIGYLISSGYALDFQNRLLAPIPGCFGKNFNQVCGSSGIVFMLPEDLPATSYSERHDVELLFARIGNHKYFEAGAMRDGRHLKPIPFPAAIYTLNNSINLSNLLVRSGERQKDLIKSIEKHAIPITDEIGRAFSLPLEQVRKSTETTTDNDLSRRADKPTTDDYLRTLSPDAKLMVRLQSYASRMGWLRSARKGQPVDRRGRPLPWYTYPAISFLSKRVNSDSCVFEFGSGNSTFWWSERVKKVHSVEHDPDWGELIRPQLPENVTFETVSLVENGDYCRAALRTGEKFDVIVIDGRDRVNCARQSLGALKPNGVIIWDNTERRRYGEGTDFLRAAGFRCLSFRGLAPIRAKELETSVFYRADNCLAI